MMKAMVNRGRRRFWIAAMLGLALPAAGATITVEESSPGIGAVEVDTSDGVCSLREAIANANADNQSGSAECASGSGADTIVLPANATFTLTDAAVLDAFEGNTGLPMITSDITIRGNGATIERDSLACNVSDFSQAASEFRLIHLWLGSLTIENATLRNGCIDGSIGDGGGAILAAIGDLTLRGVTVIDNVAGKAGGGVDMVSSGNVLVTESLFASNTSKNLGGGGIHSGGSTTLRNTTFSSNSAVRGGGVAVANQFRTHIFENLTFVDNTATLSGGGIFNSNTSINGKNLVLQNSPCAESSTIITPVWNAEGSSFDSGTTCSSIFTVPAGSSFTGNATLALGTLADNGGPTQTHALGAGSDALDAATDCTTFGGGSSITADQRGVSRPQDGDGDATATCDAGAYELLAALSAPATINVDETFPGSGIGVVDWNIHDGLCSLREAIDNANATSTASTHSDCEAGYISGADTIVLPANATFTLLDPAVLSFGKGNTGLPLITSGMTIEANGSTITRSLSLACTHDSAQSNDEFRIFWVTGAGAALTVIDASVTNGCSDATTTFQTARAGAGFYVESGRLDVIRSSISGNRASGRGGAIQTTFGAVSVEDSTLFDNRSASDAGGAIAAGGLGTSLSVRNATFSGNSAGFRGGAIDVDSNTTTTIEHATFVNNDAGASGGALRGPGITVRSSIFEESTCDVTSATAEGFNFDSGTSCADAFGSNFTAGALLDLGSLSDNGGPARTHALLPGSAGIDAVDAADCTVVTDQRGAARPFDGNGDGTARCDAGAFELASSLAVDSVTVGEGDGTATLTITRSGWTDQEHAVDVATSDGTATAGADYQAIALATITFLPGETTKTIALTVLDDSIDEGAAEAFTLGLSNETTLVTAVTGVVTVTDDDTAAVLVSKATVTTSEAGGNDAFTIVLGSQPTADVTIGLDSSDETEGTVAPASLTFTPGNWNTPQTVTVNGVDDELVDGDQPFAILTTASSADAAYAGLAVADVSATNEDDDAAGVVISPTAGLDTTEAGGTAGFTIVLGSQPTADVTIGLSSSDETEGTVAPASVVFTAADWNAPQTVTITGADDDVADGDQPFTIVTAVSSADPNYDGVAVTDVAVTNFDDDTPGIIVTSTAGLETTEAGGTAGFTIVLGSQPTADVTIGLSSSDETEGTVTPASVVFTAADWNAPQTVTVTGADDDVADGDQPYTIITTASSADPSYDGVAVADVAVTNLDDEASGIIVTPTAGLETTEAGGTAGFTIVLGSQPTADVTIGLSSSDETEGTVAPMSVVFTAADWNAPQTVTVTGADDDVADGDQPYTIATAASSADPSYDGVAVADVAVTNLDDETSGIIVTPPAGLETTEAGGTAGFTIVLGSQPTADVTIGLSSSDETEGTVAPASVVFTAANWNVAQEVTVTGVDDEIADGDQPYTIVTTASSADPSYDGVAVADVALTNLDDETSGITVTPPAGLETTEAGGTAGFTIVLGSQPTADVTIGLSSSDSSEGTVAPASVVFTAANWNVAQAVNVTGMDDELADGDAPYTILLAPVESSDPVYSGAEAPGVAVTNLDDDSAGIIMNSVSGLVTTESGSTDTFTIRLDSQPTVAVSIDLVSSDPGEGFVSPATVTFKPASWNLPQTVTITGVDDFDADGDQPYTIVTSRAMSFDPAYDGMPVPDVEVINIDDETTPEDPDGDGVPGDLEDEGPNGGDGNGDGVPDSEQDHVATIRAANGNGWITIVASCPLRDVEALTEAEIATRNRAVELPFALVAFRMPCASGDVELLFHEEQSWLPMAHYLKYGPISPGEPETTEWYELPKVVLDTKQVGGAPVARVRFTLADGELGDATGVDGWIVDPGGPAVPAQRILPVVGSTEGQGGSFFRTTIQLHNPESDPIEGRIVFVPGHGGEGAEIGYTLEPGETQSLADLLPAMGIEGLGSADVIVTGGGVPVSVVRIFNDGGEAGTAGMTAPALPVAEALTAGESGVLMAPADPDAARFNIGIRTLEATTVTMVVRSAAGVVLHTATRQYPANWFQQMTAEAFTGVGVSGSDTITLTIDDGVAIFYGATTDNLTHDPALQIAAGAPDGDRLILPVVGSLPGRGGSFFRTAVQLHNAGEERSAGRVVFVNDAAGEDAGLTYSLRAGETLAIPDLLPEMGLDGIGSAELVVTEGELPVIVVRIFNDGGEAGTAGMTAGAITPEEALATGQRGILIAPPDPETARFNIGIRTLEATTATMRVTNRDGELIRVFTRSFPARHFEQSTAQAFTGVEALSAGDAITITIDGGRAILYGSSTDNTTHDPSLQLALPVD